MDPQTPAAPTLERLLQQEIDLSRGLLDLLGNESAALAGNLPLDEQAQQQKLQLVNALQQATRSRIDFARAHRLSINGADGDAGAARLYTQLMTLAGECRERNLQIGRQLNRRARFVTGLLDSLSPTGRSSGAEVYGADGRTSRDRRGDLVDLASS